MLYSIPDIFINLISSDSYSRYEFSFEVFDYLAKIIQSLP